MREQHAYTTWLRQSWPLMIAITCGCFLPQLVVHGQGPGDETVPRARFGSVRVVDEKAVVPSSETLEVDKDLKQKKPGGVGKDAGVLLYDMPVTPPNSDQLFRLDSEEMFRDRLRTEVTKRFPKVKLEFPEAAPLVFVPPRPRDGQPHVKWVEPSYVVSRRLLFEQPRFERFGETLGVLQPPVSMGIFSLDLVLLPARRMAQPFRCYQVNTDCYSPYVQMVRE